MTAIAGLRAITAFTSEHEDALLMLDEAPGPMTGVYAVPVDGDPIELHLHLDLDFEEPEDL